MSNTLKLKIKGMTCGSCSNSITARVSKFDFTDNVKVDWESGLGSMDVAPDFDENKGKVLQVIAQMGYEAEEA